jgi:hypothetical protein
MGFGYSSSWITSLTGQQGVALDVVDAQVGDNVFARATFAQQLLHGLQTFRLAVPRS